MKYRTKKTLKNFTDMQNHITVTQNQDTETLNHVTEPQNRNKISISISAFILTTKWLWFLYQHFQVHILKQKMSV